MKKDIHPKVNPVIFVDTSCGVEFATTSTLTTKETRVVDGVTYFVYPIEISSASHPFYTGKQVLVDTARRVEKFQEKMAKQENVASARKGKKVKRAATQAKKVAKKKAEEKTENK